MGFTGPEHYVSDALEIKYDERSNYQAEYEKYATNIKGVYAAGDCRRGQSLVVWGICENQYLFSVDSNLFDHIRVNARIDSGESSVLPFSNHSSIVIVCKAKA